VLSPVGNAPPWLHQYLWQRLAQDYCISESPEKGPFSHLPASFEGDGEVCCCLEKDMKRRQRFVTELFNNNKNALHTVGYL